MESMCLRFSNAESCQGTQTTFGEKTRNTNGIAVMRCRQMATKNELASIAIFPLTGSSEGAENGPLGVPRRCQVNKKTSPRLSSGERQSGTRTGVALPALPRWRWLAYLGTGGIIFAVIFVKIGGVLPDKIDSFAAWRDSGEIGNLAISGVFTGLIMAMVVLFLDLAFLGVAQRKSKLQIAEDLAVFAGQAAIGVAAEGLLGAAASSASSGDSSSGGFTSGGGGDFGGGGASGKF